MESAANRNGSSPMRSLERALGVLAVLEQSRAPLRLSEVARRAGLHVATTQRILATLGRFDYVAQEPLGYTIGPATVLNAHAYIVANSVSRAAAPVLQELASATGLSASLALRVGFSRVMVGRVEGAKPLRYQMPIGERLPLLVGASGRVLTAAMSGQDVKVLLERVGEVRLASGEVVPHKRYLAELVRIRSAGFAYGQSERVLGAGSMAVPVVNDAGETVAAIGLSVLTDGLDQSEIETLANELKRAATAVSERLA